MHLDNMHPQSGQQGQETSAGADKDSGGRSSDGTQASRCRQGKQIRPDSRNRQQIQPARKYPFLSVCGIFAQVAAMGRRPESLAPSTFAAGVVGACAIRSGTPPAPVRRLFAAELVQIIMQGVLYRGDLDRGGGFHFCRGYRF